MIAVLWLILLANIVILLLVIWNSIGWPEPSLDHTLLASDLCSVLVPARNEADNIEECLQSALNQGEIVGEVIVCDDQSDDGTAEIVRAMAARDSRVRLIVSIGPPSGWYGKSNACALLAAEAQCEWLLFLDADARMCKEGVGRMIAEAMRRKLDLLSCWPGLLQESFWEKVLMPMLNFVVFTLFPAPLSILRDADASLGLAHGACIMVQREQYERFGGHSLVSDQLFEDTALARTWRAAGGLALCLDGKRIVHVRMYDSLATILNGFTKNFYPAFHHTINFWLFLFFHAVCFLLPFGALILMHGHGFYLAGAVSLCVFIIRAFQAIKFGYPLWTIVFHPVAESMMILVGLRSWWRCQSGKGVIWKGRLYLDKSSSMVEAKTNKKTGTNHES